MAAFDLGLTHAQGPIKLETFSLKDVQSIRLLVDDKPVPMEMLPSKVVPSP